ncbi:hypothetical protein AA14337_2987 [Acetobacter malorum DSM 14337]|uniref:Uncharacterized protein n=1 Tax=Acetobacter malorum DSM 14337 TaxID=1307910 RepID=A0ABQ0PZ02_9PROT|nr:hypothetical protein [Acetobacter malorum]KXV06716.1 hypothetical protein AD930_06325 [Acetobacter malorum]GBQ85075.1 hypothetical protein AA14337_2987 [Acetobacter malorum DSM 14337]
MGWKTFKDRFCNSDYIVSVESGDICIGSPVNPTLIRVTTEGEMRSALRIRGKKAFLSFLEQNLPALAAASQREIVAAIAAEDTFGSNIKVYTYSGGDILEKSCEQLGWPNVTHDGELMSENTFSPDRAYIIELALRDAQSWAEHLVIEDRRLKEKLAKIHKDMNENKVRRKETAKEIARLRLERRGAKD